MKKTKVTIGIPWYAGPDVDCFPKYLAFSHYLGRLRERSIWLQALQDKGIEFTPGDLTPLDPIYEDDTHAEIMGGEDWGEFEFNLAVERMSLPGLARERVVEMALSQGSEWLLMWDSDMLFSPSVFLRLLRWQKPIVNALAFTSRDPIMPCLYKIRHGFDPISKQPTYDSETVWDIPDKPLISNEDIGGEMAFGAGVILINTNVFRQIAKPWFFSTGCGEDWLFCVRAMMHGVPRYSDTSQVILHKAFQPRFFGRESYEQARKDNPEEYQKLYERKGVV
jgi:hypothetical protein